MCHVENLIDISAVNLLHQQNPSMFRPINSLWAAVCMNILKAEQQTTIFIILWENNHNDELVIISSVVIQKKHLFIQIKNKETRC